MDDRKALKRRCHFRLREDIVMEAEALVRICNRSAGAGDQINMTGLVEMALVSFTNKVKRRMKEQGLLSVAQINQENDGSGNNKD